MAAAIIRILDMKLQTIILTVGWSRTKLTVLRYNIENINGTVENH